jgi:hypothetical protein
MFCPSCGKKLEDDWNICPYCGQKVETPRKNNISENQNQTEQKKLDLKIVNVNQEKIRGQFHFSMKYVSWAILIIAIICLVHGCAVTGVALALAAILFHPMAKIKLVKYKNLRLSAIIVCIFVGVLFLFLSAGKNEYINMVKSAESYATQYEGITYGEAFDAYFDSETWDQFQSEDNQNVVEFTGTYKNAVGGDVQFLCQFVCEDSGAVQVHYMSIDGEIFDASQREAFMIEIFEHCVEYNEKY